MKKIFIIIITFIMIPSFVYAEDIEIESKSALLVNRTNNEILYSKEENQVLPIASLTKIMTTLVSLENIKSLDELVVITKQDISSLDGYVVIGLEENMEVSYKDLIYSTMMYSAADSANTLSNHVFNDYSLFIDKMNELANTLEMTNTHFSNPIGKDIDNYSTCSDLYKLIDYALNNKNFYDIFTKNKYNLSFIDKTITNNINNSIKRNELENKNNIKINGSKSGYTSKSGLSLSTESIIDDNELILITLNAMGLQDTHKHLIDQLNILNYFKDTYSNRVVLKKSKLIDTIIYKKKDKEINYNIKSTKEHRYYLPNNFNLDYLKIYYDGLINIDNTIKENDKLGTIYIYLEDKLIGKEEVLFKKENLETNKINYRNLIIMVSICLFSLIVFRKKKKKN